MQFRVIIVICPQTHPPTDTHTDKPTDRTEYNTLHSSLACSVIKHKPNLCLTPFLKPNRHCQRKEEKIWNINGTTLRALQMNNNQFFLWPYSRTSQVRQHYTHHRNRTFTITVSQLHVNPIYLPSVIAHSYFKSKLKIISYLLHVIFRPPLGLIMHTLSPSHSSSTFLKLQYLS